MGIFSKISRFVTFMPKDKRKHAFVATAGFFTVWALLVSFMEIKQVHATRIAWVAAIAAAALWELGQKVFKKGDPSVSDFLYSALFPTLFLFISEIINLF